MVIYSKMDNIVLLQNFFYQFLLLFLCMVFYYFHKLAFLYVLKILTIVAFHNHILLSSY